MALGTWDEIRTAFHVARLGTVSGAADALGVHHATVIRHIDALEERLGAKLFQRHARGYTATEAGRDLLQVAQTTDDQFAQLEGRIKGRGEEVRGELIVTALPGLAAMFVPALARFQDAHPEVIVRFLTDVRLFRLEYGEAHVAIRAGTMPDEPDNVVQPFCQIRGGFYAASRYVEDYGHPGDSGDFSGHRFVGYDTESKRAPAARWLAENTSADQVVFRSTEIAAIQRAVIEGIGIGFLPVATAAEFPDLVEMLPPRDEWCTPLWLVTHVDLHRSAKVQTFTRFLKDDANSWSECGQTM